MRRPACNIHRVKDRNTLTVPYVVCLYGSRIGIATTVGYGNRWIDVAVSHPDDDRIPASRTCAKRCTERSVRSSRRIAVKSLLNMTNSRWAAAVVALAVLE